MNSRTRKLVEKFVYRIDAVTLSDCENILAAFGYTWTPKPGSHRMYRKEGAQPFNLPTHGGREVKRVYKVNLRDFLRLEEVLEESEND